MQGSATGARRSTSQAETVALALIGRAIKSQALNLFEDVAVITLVLDWRDVDDYYLQTVCASISSYCRGVPMNRTFDAVKIIDPHHDAILVIPAMLKTAR
jgi:hypothetical protein